MQALLPAHTSQSDALNPHAAFELVVTQVPVLEQHPLAQVFELHDETMPTMGAVGQPATANPRVAAKSKFKNGDFM